MLKAHLLSTIKHGFLTRQGGVSEGPFHSLNLASGRGDSPENLARNRDIALDRVGLSGYPLLLLRQIHSNIAHIVSAPWPLDNNNIPCVLEGDALVTSTPGLALGILTADCAPVLFYDPEASVIAAAHAGWRGAFQGIIASTVNAMKSLGADPTRIRAAIGPCIHQESYEMGEEVFEEFISQSPENKTFFENSEREHHYYFNLPGYVDQCLKKMGIHHIETLPFNTYQHHDLFFSFRRSTHQEEAVCGNHISLIAL